MVLHQCAENTVRIRSNSAAANKRYFCFAAGAAQVNAYLHEHRSSHDGLRGVPLHNANSHLGSTRFLFCY